MTGEVVPQEERSPKGTQVPRLRFAPLPMNTFLSFEGNEF
jgi:hypothetical protein